METNVKQNVLIIDTYSQHSSHEMFNTSLFLMFSIIFEKVDLKISKSSYKNYLKIINRELPKNIQYSSVKVVEGSGRFSLLARYIFSALQNIIYLFMAPKDSIIVFPYNNLFSVRTVNFCNKFLNKKIIIFCHGEMEGIVKDVRKEGFLHKLLIKLACNFFLNKSIKISSGLFFSVLGDDIKENIKKLIDENKIVSFISVDHPYLFDHKYNNVGDSAKMNLGTVGTMNKTKGLLNFFEFAKNMNPSLKEKVNVYAIGAIRDANLFTDTNIKLATKNNALLSREEFNKKVNELDYILFFYPSDSYIVTASGAIMDAIRFEKPIIALKNPYFEYIFKKFGVFGYLLNNIDEMILKVEDLVIGDSDYCIDFQRIKNDFSPETISLQLKKELIKIGLLGS